MFDYFDYNVSIALKTPIGIFRQRRTPPYLKIFIQCGGGTRVSWMTCPPQVVNTACGIRTHDFLDENQVS